MRFRPIELMVLSFVWVGGSWAQEAAKGGGKASVAVVGQGEVAEAQPMQIQAEGGMRLEQAKGYGRFYGGVILISPMDGVVMNAKELEVYFEPSEGEGTTKNAGGSGDRPVAGGKPSKESGPKQEKGGTDGLRQVVATGEVAIVQERKRPDGAMERSVAKAHRAVYETATGNVTLTGWPQVKNGDNVVTALSEDTVIVMNEKGVLDVQGKSKGSFVRDASGLKRVEKPGAKEGNGQ